MTSDWNYHTDTEGLYYPMHHSSGKPLAYVDWNRPDDLVRSTNSSWQESQSSIALSRQSASGVPFPQSAGMIPDPSGYWSHDVMHAAPHDRRSWQSGPFCNPQQGHDAGWNTGLTGLHYGYLNIEHKQEQIHYDPKYSVHQAAIPRGPKSPPRSGPSSLRGSIGRRNGSKGRRSTIASISDQSDAASCHTGSEESDPTSMSDDAQYMNNETHLSPRLRPASRASPRNCHSEPILGDLHQGAHTIVQQSLDPGYKAPEGGIDNTKLDPRYDFQRDPRRFFCVGRVFSMLWHENAGQHGTTKSQKAYTKGKFQEPIYSSIRRMVVIKEQKGCCWCIPVTTYSGQGIAKAGVDKNKHAILYMRGTEPARGPSESKMAKEPLEVEPHDRTNSRLDPMSRINFGKIYTVEHNVKVSPVGRITKEGSLDKLLEYTKHELSKGF